MTIDEINNLKNEIIKEYLNIFPNIDLDENSENFKENLVIYLENLCLPDDKKECYYFK